MRPVPLIIAIATSAARVDPLESRFPSSAAVAYLYEDEAEQAIDLAAAALSLDRTDRLAANITAANLLQKGEYQAAVNVVSDALRRNPGFDAVDGQPASRL